MRLDTALRAAQWLLRHDTGVSSKVICATMLGLDPADRHDHHPHDPGDFGRCERLLRQFPEWRERLDEMRDCSAEWAALVQRWKDIADCMEAEVGIDWSKGQKAERTYLLMRAIILKARAAA